ncbi:MAG: serpin family protein [Bacteroidales bacterium]|nr:serpin family protein [Bacteroidales bacterium]
MKRILSLLAVALLLAPACSKIDREDNLRGSDLKPVVPIRLTKSDEGIRDASNDFGLNTFRLLYGDGGTGDVAFSPLSLSLALAMAAEGAEGQTWQQFADVIGWDAATKEELGAYYRKMVDGLVKADESVQFTSANSFWTARTLRMRSSYASLLKDYFQAEAYEVDFSLPATLEQINRWCSDKTDGKIPQMLSAIDPDTALMLINALLFKAPWRLTWDIKPGRDFTAASGAKVKKDYLYVQDQQLTYGDFGDFELVRAPYGNTAYQMDIILPKEGKTLAEILPQVESDAVNYDLQTTEVTLYLPKWSTDYSTGDALIPALKAQGLTLPFDPYGQADFSGISEQDIYINKIQQKVRIDVTEKGTEFAAVTVVGFGFTAVMPVSYPKVTVDVNRPFAYTIRETTSGTILLLGTLSE